MSNPFIGQITIFAGNFAPKGWAFCQGQSLALNQYQALFAIIGTTYGGNGTTNFNLPDLRGRVAVSQGQGPGLSSYVLGQQAGQENVTLNVSQMPTHSHNVLGSGLPSGSQTPAGNFPGIFKGGAQDIYASSASTPAIMNPAMIQSQGGSLPHTNIQPTLAINYIIALQGIYPSRD